jgi:hypothetical protein
MTSSRVPFPAAVDATVLRTFKGCEQKAWYGFFEHLQIRAKSAHLIAGGAFARGLEVFRLAFYRDGASREAARALALAAIIEEWGDAMPMFSWDLGASPKSLDRVLEAFDYYLQVWPPETDAIKPLIRGDTAGVEFTFCIPLPNVRHPETGDPIMYCGRFDMIGEFNRAMFVVDEKTTKQLGASWTAQWTLRSQFTGYAYAARQFGYPVAGAIVRGISFLKDKFGSAEVITYRPDWLVDRWLAETEDCVERMIAMWRRVNDGTGHPRQDLDETCAGYGGCQYLDLCCARDPTPWKNDTTRFETRVWNPLAKI